MRRKAFIVIASSWDGPAQSFAARYADLGVRLMTPEDLSRSGWNYRVGQAPRSTARIGEDVLSAEDIAAVLTRIPCVTAHDLPHIAPADRTYVAAEMTAFLLAWLTELKCPLINRPTPRCLSGPDWPPEKWVQTAARIGIPTDTTRRQIRLSNKPVEVTCPEHKGATATIVGRRCIGTVDHELGQAALALMEAAGTELLVVRFSGPQSGARFMEANHWADLADRETGEAVFQRLRDAKK